MNSIDEKNFQAYELILEAYESSKTKGRKLAKKALEIDPDSVEAYIYLGDVENDIYKAIKFYKKGIKIYEKKMGKEFFKKNKGHFWLIASTRPYMIALQNLAECYAIIHEMDKAIKIYEKMLRLNPHDNQGIRYILISFYLRKEYFKKIKQLMKKYPDESSALWLYNVALYFFITEGNSIKANEKLKEAYRSNPYVIDFLLCIKEIPEIDKDYYIVGHEDEAAIYALENIDIWLKYPDTVKWLFEFKIRNSEKSPITTKTTF